MLTIICGEDNVTSRNSFSSLQHDFQIKGYYIQKILPNQIEEIIKSQGNDLMLFNEKKVYAVEHLTTFTARKKSKEFESLIKKLIEDTAIEVLDWEDKSAREIKLKGAIKEYKPTKTIFQLQEACYPGNLAGFLKSLNEVAMTQEEGFIFTMLTRHIRTLLLARTKQLASSLSPWMRQKYEAQANKWTVDGLIGFYEGMARLDSSLKTSGNIYGIKGSVELVACYFLK